MLGRGNPDRALIPRGLSSASIQQASRQASQQAIQQECVAMDIVYLGLGAGFFALMAAYARWAAEA